MAAPAEDCNECTCGHPSAGPSAPLVAFLGCRRRPETRRARAVAAASTSTAAFSRRSCWRGRRATMTASAVRSRTGPSSGSATSLREPSTSSIRRAAASKSATSRFCSRGSTAIASFPPAARLSGRPQLGTQPGRRRAPRSRVDRARPEDPGTRPFARRRSDPLTARPSLKRLNRRARRPGLTSSAPRWPRRSTPLSPPASARCSTAGARPRPTCVSSPPRDTGAPASCGIGSARQSGACAG